VVALSYAQYRARILDLDAVELAARGARHHEIQALVQRSSPMFHEPGGVGLSADADVPPCFGGC
jgi:hypothetical protein